MYIRALSNHCVSFLTTGIANVAKRERNRGAKQLDALTKVSRKMIQLVVRFAQ